MNQLTPSTSDELYTKLEPGVCSLCQTSLKIQFLESLSNTPKSYFYYFYLTSKNKNLTPSKYIIFICNQCHLKQIQQQLQFSLIYTNHLTLNQFQINQLSNQKKAANQEDFTISFQKNSSQAAQGYLSTQNIICENCSKLEEQFEAYEKSFIKYASCTSQRAFEIAKQLALEELRQDKRLCNQYSEALKTFNNNNDQSEQFYLMKKLQKISEKYEYIYQLKTISLEAFKKIERQLQFDSIILIQLLYQLFMLIDTYIQEESLAIESLNCSFVNCQKPLIQQGNKFMYFFYKQNPQMYRIESHNYAIEQGLQDQKQLEIKFICQKCIDILKKEGQQYLLNIQNKIQINENYSVYFNKDERESTSPPKQGTFTVENQYCKKCLDNQNIIKEFDKIIQKCGHKNITQTIEIAKYYAEEQYHKDKEILHQLKIRLFKIGNHFSGRMEKLLILNKIRMIMKKYNRNC